MLALDARWPGKTGPTGHARSPRKPLMLASLVVLGLHGVAGWGVATWAVSRSTQTPPPRVLAVRMLPLPTPVAGAPAAAESADSSSRATALRSHAAGQQATLDAPLAPAEFLSSDEVDSPARPLSAWTLDAESLAALGIRRIVFDSWVDATSTLVKLHVVSMEPASTLALAPLVEARLAATTMVAARKQGRPVAHMQRVELSWEPLRGEPG